MSSYTIKTIRTTIIMAQGVFKDGHNTLIIEGLPVSAKISKPGGQDENKLSLTIKNLSLEKMDQMTTLAFRSLQLHNNIVTIEAGSLGQELDLVFSGEIQTAIPVFNDSGGAEFKIEATTGAYPNKIASPPTSIQGDVTVAELMEQFAKEAGYSFQNEGVDMRLKNSIFRGSPIMKARTLARQMGIELLLDDRKMLIMPKGGYVEGTAPKLSKDDGLLGYPSFTNDGIEVKTIYDSRLTIGGLVEIQSVVPKASGVWKISKLDHDLEAYQSSNGKWESSFSGAWVKEASRDDGR